MSPRNEEQNAQIKDERREQILSGALRVFATRGFAAAKISDIVAQSGVSHGLVYHYFASKEEIFYTLLQRALETSVQSIQMTEALPVGPLEKVRYIARYILGGIESYEDSAYYFMIVVHASVMEGPAENANVVSQSGESMHIMARIIEAGQKAGEMREGDAYGMALAFFAAIQGLAQYKLAMQGFIMPDPETIVNIVKK
jgi:AcrR family transcriptional regulator